MVWTPQQKAFCVSQYIISNKSDIQWSPHSPDLNPPDFFLWGYLKDRVYANRPHTINDLKANITHEISQIPRQMRDNVMRNFRKRLQVCLERNGGHLEHVLKHKDD